MISLTDSVPSVCVRGQKADRVLQTSKPWIGINMINTKHCYCYFISSISSTVSSFYPWVEMLYNRSYSDPEVNNISTSRLHWIKVTIHSNVYIKIISDAAQRCCAGLHATLILIKKARQQFTHSRVFKFSGDESTQARESTRVVCN